MLLHAQKHNHAASQSTVPLMAYEDDVYKFYKKENERKTPQILLNYVEQINNSLTHAHDAIRTNLLGDEPIFLFFFLSFCFSALM